MDHDVLDLADADAWAAWLEANHELRRDAWLRIAKRRSGIATIGITDALDVALCFGWIDGHRKGLDEVSFLQRYSRRTARSSWSAVNVAKAEALIAAGRMRPAGLAEIAAATADGRWDAAYPSQANAEVPADLAAALAADPPAAAAFDKLGRTERYLLILPLLKATTPATRSTALTKTMVALTQV